ncbi:hypothetical protein SRDD_33280 [Serratia sp. DD3]|nr:hypothetical protein SRDD_33280 [Serratia sp. DD3]
MCKTPGAIKVTFTLAQTSIAPYTTQGRLKLYFPSSTLLPSIEVLATPIHTPSHTAHLFNSEGQHILLWIELVHNRALTFIKSEIPLEFGSDRKQAVTRRLKPFADIA